MPACYVCGTDLGTPATEEIKRLYTDDGVALCLKPCLNFYKRYKGQFSSSKSMCKECFKTRVLVDNYCGPCWAEWEGDGAATETEKPEPQREAERPIERSSPRHREEPEEPALDAANFGCTGCGFEICNDVWACGSCTVENPCSFPRCVVCNASRDTQKAKPQQSQPQRQQTQRAEQPRAASPRAAAASPRASPWTCGECSIENSPVDDECVVCTTPRHRRAASPAGPPPPAPAARTTAAAPPPSPATWECGICTLINEISVLQCLACDTLRPDVITPAPPVPPTAAFPQPAEADEEEEPIVDGWACRDCTYINPDTALQCEVCDAVRGYAWLCPHCTTGHDAMPEKCSVCGWRPVEVVGETWKCKRCATVNNANFLECGNCQLEKSWFCDECTLENEGGTQQCAVCNSKRVGKKATWECKRCTSENPVTALVCNGCDAVRPSTKKNKVLTLKQPMEYGDVSFRERRPKGLPKPPKQPVVWTPPPGSAPRPSQRPAAREYNMDGRFIMLIENLKKSDKVNNHALRLAFERLGASNVQVLIKDGKKTGKAAVEFDTQGELDEALVKTKKMTLCESKITTHKISFEEFKTLPETWTRGKQEHVARPDHIPVGAKPTNRVAVVRENRCRNDKCSRECFKICPVGAINSEGLCKINESICTGCNMCMKKRGQKTKGKAGCPFDAIIIVNIPKELTEHVVMRYGKNGFTLCHLPQMRQDKLLGIIGENGSGKSTALKILSGKLTPNSGGSPSWQPLKNKYKGTELQGLITKLEGGKQRCSFKVQHVDKLRENKLAAQAFLETFTDDEDRIEALVEALNLTHLMERSVSVLSGGELQRLAIAAACAKDADIYLFDEPSSYLDVKQRLRACEIIREQLEGNKYVVCVEHDLAVCDYLADSVAVIHGKASAFGVVTKAMNVRDGINAFLEGYIEQENVRFRSHALVFKMHDEMDLVGETQWEYPAASKTRDTFKLDITSGTLKACEVTAFLGENGCGKTTLLEIMSGKLNTDSDTPFLAERGCLKPQVIEMPQGKTVKEVLEEGLSEEQKNDRVLRDEVLLPLKIDDLFILDADKLSGGEMQRVALALALASESELILIDEPSAFLDAEQRMVAAKAIRRIAMRKKKVVVVVEHDLMMTSFMADKVVVFEGVPGVACRASKPEPVSSGMNRFLRQLDVTVRLDAVSHRPRFNKKNSVIDKEQRSRGEFYADAAEIKDKITGIACSTCSYDNKPTDTHCTRCGIPLSE